MEKATVEERVLSNGSHLKQPGFPTNAAGWNIQKTAERLRNYVFISRMGIRTLAGWFMAIRAYEHKYRLGYNLYDHAEHADWLLRRLEELRSGKLDANIRPSLRQLLEEVLHAPSDEAFLRGFYGVLIREVVQALADDLKTLDPAANANETRLLGRMLEDLKAQLRWFDALPLSAEKDEWSEYLASLMHAAGGIHGDREQSPVGSRPHAGFFTRPKTILFDERIKIGPLMSYAERAKLSPPESVVEQFKVFFNEMYAAAFAASILFDAGIGDLPWGFFRDCSRHFWDEVRHSEFGCVRLKELGSAPDRCNPILFDEVEDLPVLHRIAYLTRGLEAYFMPRKSKRFREYEESGDYRSQLFADQDWSDEINHVRYGATWSNHILEEDNREIEEVLEEVKAHLTKVRGVPVTTVDAPF